MQLASSSSLDEWAEQIKVRTVARMTQRVLESRFGPLSPAVAAAISQAEPSTLDALVRYVGIETLEQIRTCLGPS